ncbi:MAG: MmgE/PrpD family protein [Alphaproteobacteria bacterium]
MAHGDRVDGLTASLAALAADTVHDDLDEAARRAVRRHTLDTVGACLAGAGQPVTRLAGSVLAEFAGTGNAPIPGTARRADALTAAYLTGAAGHGLEVDDGARAASTHPGVVVVPPLLAAVTLDAYDGKQLLAAIAVGYEVALRVGEGIHPASRRRGFHNTSVAGVFGAAAAVGSLRGLDAATMEQAFGIAASSAAGLFAFLHGGGEIKRLHPGHAAREGLLAVLLAERGMTGPAGVLEVRDGVFAAFSGDKDRAALVAPPSARGGWAVTRCYVKPYACCRHLHAAVDAVRDIVLGEKIAAEDIASVEVGTYAIAADHAETGWDDMASAQMSFPFVLANAMLGNDLGLAEFGDEARADGRRHALCAKVRIATDAECDADYPDKRAAKTRLTTTAGTVHERYVPEPYGAPANPMSDAALTAKFHGLADPVLGADKAALIEKMVMAMETLSDAAALAEATTANREENAP